MPTDLHVACRTNICNWFPADLLITHAASKKLVIIGGTVRPDIVLHMLFGIINLSSAGFKNY